MAFNYDLATKLRDWLIKLWTKSKMKSSEFDTQLKMSLQFNISYKTKSSNFNSNFAWTAYFPGWARWLIVVEYAKLIESAIFRRFVEFQPEENFPNHRPCRQRNVQWLQGWVLAQRLDSQEAQ
jgi:hypothetical protein